MTTPDTLTLTEIDEPQWRELRNHLANSGWAMQAGGGLNHSWAILRKGEWEIHMACDDWVDGSIRFPVEVRDEIAAILPAAFKGNE